MDSTLSVSKGCFVFKNGATRNTKKNRKKIINENSTLLPEDLNSELWYDVFKTNWQIIGTAIEKLQYDNYSKTMTDVLSFIEISSTNYDKEIIPTAALLTGINQPDHHKQFEILSNIIKENDFTKIATLKSRDCPTMKSTIETMVSSLLDDNTSDDIDVEVKQLRRSQCTMQALKLWYLNKIDNKNGKDPLIIIIPDFEVFSTDVLQDFILVLSSYSSYLPFILVLGVATAVSALHNALSYNVTSKMRLQVFHSEQATISLNKMIDSVLLNPLFSFHLSSKVFKFLLDIFLFYDFSVNGFSQGFKYCMLEHYSQGNIYALCSSFIKTPSIINSLSHNDLENIRRLLSFRPYVESQTDNKAIIKLLTDDDYLKNELFYMSRNVHDYWFFFHFSLQILHTLVNDLPKHPLGKQLRELYTNCISSNIQLSDEFKEAWSLLSFLSKEDFIEKLQKCLIVLQTFRTYSKKMDVRRWHILNNILNIINNKFERYLSDISNAGFNLEKLNEEPEIVLMENMSSRLELKEKLLQMSKQPKVMTEYTRSLIECLDYLKNDIIDKYLLSVNQGPTLIELFIFSDVPAIRRHIVGSPRAAIHTALNNPHVYLQCDCCELDSINNITVLPTLPDLSIVYKLHLECGRMINLFDWLQAFKSIVSDNDDDPDVIDAQIQARFTRAVAELQFLGFIKSSKRKTDHVTRLTW